MNRILLALVVAAVVFTAVWTLRDGKESVEPPGPKAANATAPASRATPTPDVVLAIKPSAKPTSRQSRESAKLSPLMQELASGPKKSLYDRLVEKASRTPEEDFVLARILEMCTDVGGRFKDPRAPVSREEARKAFEMTVSEKDPDRARRIAAYQKMSESTCDGFEGVKTDPKKIAELIDAAAAGGDPKARARVVEREVWACCAAGSVRGDTLPTITDEQLRTLQDSVRTGDPYAMLIAGSILSSTLGNLMIQAGADQRTVDARAFHDAWTLAACNAGYDCGPSNPMILNGCSRNGNCGAQNVEEYLYFYGNSPQQSQLINEYRSQLTQAMQTGDWSYFTFVRARPPAGFTFFFRGGPAGP
jgi:hypothetical protein